VIDLSLALIVLGRGERAVAATMIVSLALIVLGRGERAVAADMIGDLPQRPGGTAALKPELLGATRALLHLGLLEVTHFGPLVGDQTLALLGVLPVLLREDGFGSSGPSVARRLSQVVA